ncbi:polysaccharide pyruvyl transferase family protein [Sphingobacterium haloxyli]|uniref:Polysaccharide pyruvyl transferase domain-containing protein n=1 Tax=Sphingobacterium haloxyli TaxID=2100533 RepID=A0A2S9J242_9SPHI|nr:polysaccharide pyruvyl transferase family protein [Sphingobacterium haloxyli]PRD46853.1 hypothetical protein C5745_13385 [Sphingobacterium haloxyli]
MKIGIITFHRAVNYGAVLQAFALKKYLETCGHTVEFVDYWPAYRAEMYDLYRSHEFKENVSMLRKAYRLAKLLLVLPQKRIRYDRFNRFIDRELGVKGGQGLADVSQLEQGYDCLVYGSDQIWRRHRLKSFTGYDSFYWGEFFTTRAIKKVAYAASMGVLDIDRSEEAQIDGWLQNFDHISIRERALFNKLKAINTSKMDLVLDPVFLLGSTAWLEIASSDQIVTEDFILFYHLLYSPEAVDLVKTLAQKYKLKVIEINGGVKPLKSPNRYYQTAGPREFITLVSKAKYVVSTSFHGIVFSLVFKKRFFALSMGNNADRVKDLLAILKLSDRYLLNIHDHETINDIDYGEVQKLLDAEIQKSKGFLETALERN